MKFVLQHSFYDGAYREGVSVDANVDRCNRKRHKISLYMYDCIDTRARSKSCSNEAKFFNVQNIIQIYF